MFNNAIFSNLMMFSMMGQSLGGCGCGTVGNLDYGYGSGWGNYGGFGCGTGFGCGNSIWGMLGTIVGIKAGAALFNYVVPTVVETIHDNRPSVIQANFNDKIAAKQTEIDKELKKMPTGYNTDKTYKNATVEKEYEDAIKTATNAKDTAKTAWDNGKSALKALEDAFDALAPDSTSTTIVVGTTTYGATTGSNADLKQAIKDAIAKQKTENEKLEKAYNEAVKKEEEAKEAKESRKKEIEETKTKLDKLFKELNELYEENEDDILGKVIGKKTKDDEYNTKYGMNQGGKVRRLGMVKVTKADLRKAMTDCQIAWKKTDNDEERKTAAENFTLLYNKYNDTDFPRGAEEAYKLMKDWLQRHP